MKKRQRKTSHSLAGSKASMHGWSTMLMSRETLGLYREFGIGMCFCLREERPPRVGTGQAMCRRARPQAKSNRLNRLRRVEKIFDRKESDVK